MPEKPALRQRFLEQRMQIPPALRASAAVRACDLFFNHVPLEKGMVVAGYWPIRAELDDLPILREALKRGCLCALPQVAGEGAPLLFRAWDEAAELAAGAFGIMEPKDSPPLVPDIVLAPLLAFDRRGHRLGYGSGFYDRTLAYLRKTHSVLAVGLSFEAQFCDTLPDDETDMALDMVISEKKVYSMGRKG